MGIFLLYGDNVQLIIAHGGGICKFQFSSGGTGCPSSKRYSAQRPPSMARIRARQNSSVRGNGPSRSYAFSTKVNNLIIFKKFRKNFSYRFINVNSTSTSADNHNYWFATCEIAKLKAGKLITL